MSAAIFPFWLLLLALWNFVPYWQGLIAVAGLEFKGVKFFQAVTTEITVAIPRSTSLVCHMDSRWALLCSLFLLLILEASHLCVHLSSLLSEISDIWGRISLPLVCQNADFDHVRSCWNTMYIQKTVQIKAPVNSYLTPSINCCIRDVLFICFPCAQCNENTKSTENVFFLLFLTMWSITIQGKF